MTTATTPPQQYVACVRCLANAKERLQPSLDRMGDDRADALENHHHRVQEIDDAWQRIPEEQRVMLRPPERESRRS